MTVAGPAGRLEALLDEPAGPPRAVAIVCHPHPLHQGTMHNKVTHTLARTFKRLGAAAVRFNFRGVGESEGEHDGGAGEQDDVAAVAAWCRERWPGFVPFLAGFSFGAATAYLTAERLGARALVTVALPVARVGRALPPACPWLAVHGERDDVVPVAALREWLETIAPRPELALLDDADHFFHGRLPALRDAVAAFLAGRFPELGEETSDAARAR